MTSSAPRFQSYAVGGTHETILRFGPIEGPQLFIIEPLFEERNALRSTIVEIARGLANHQIGCVIPDLPGTGESETALDGLTADDLSEAVAQVAEAVGTTFIASFRSGALVAGTVAAHHCHIAPTSGADLSRYLRRLETVAPAGNDFGGYQIPDVLIGALEACELGNAHTIEAALLPSRPWLRTEPYKDIFFSQYVTDLLAQWIRTCEKL